MEIEKAGEKFPLLQKNYKELGPFVYDDVEFEKTLGDRRKQLCYDIKLGKYRGEWLMDTVDLSVKEGKGILLLPSGNIYDGYWKNDKQEHSGR